MFAVGYVTLFIVGLYLPLLWLHHEMHGSLNYLQAGLSLFLVINFMICLWEIVLFFYIDIVKASYLGKKKKLERGSLGKIFLFEQVSLSDALRPSYWAEVWAVYSLVDTSYCDTSSFGWNIDIGNGFSTLIPTVLFAVGMTLQEQLMGARVLGIIGALSFYQEFYGTVVYFTQYIINKRWENHGNSWVQIGLLVLSSNIVWMIGPGIGLYTSCRLILEENKPYSIFT